MTLSNLWKKRIEMWEEELTRHFYTPLGTIEMQYFTTCSRLSWKEALEGAFTPAPAGTRWGAKWEYGWFKGKVLLPSEVEGRRVIANLEVGGESTVFINGNEAGCVRRYDAWTGVNPIHLNKLLLNECAKTGEEYDFLIECYAGHGARVAHLGPTPPERVTVPEPESQQVVVGDTTFGIWQEEIYQLWIDVQTLHQISEGIDRNSLRAAKIERVLKDFTLTVDFEQSLDVLLQTVAVCREKLKPLLACKNGSTMPEFYAFGHSHLDIMYMWTLEETRRKCARTFSTQLELMNQYPGYRFLLSQPYLLDMTKNNYPQLYERMKEKVKNGQIMPEGGMWVEADTNLPGGESLIRQFIHGKRFLKEEFDLQSELLWLPDVFGYSGALPQIMRGCGIKYFSTAKLLSTFVSGETFPHTTFVWEGIDGSETLVSLCRDYSMHTRPADVIRTWNDRVQKDGISSLLYPFGHGDGGGGATRDHLEYIKRIGDLEGAPKTKMAHPVEFFKDLEREGMPEARYVGELYMQAHRGTYTTQAKTKKYNRKSEFALREAEMWGAAALESGWFQYPYDRMDELWKMALLNQFHDVIPGSSIQKVFEEVEESYQKLMNQGEIAAHEARISLCRDEEAITVFNSLSWERTALVELPEGMASVTDHTGEILESQELNGKVYVEATLPSCGYKTYKKTEHKAESAEDVVKAGDRTLENDLLRIEFNAFGEITVMIDKETGRQLLDGRGNVFKMYKDVPSMCDAWELEPMYEQQEVEMNSAAVFETVCEGGPLFARIKISKTLHHSKLTQYVTVRRGSRRVDFETRIDWQERHKLLKVCFPVDIHAHEAVHEIQFGHIRRPNHRSRQFDADRFEVSNHKWTALMEENRGAAVLNDCKYGVNVLGKSINLTLLKAALAPDMNADRGIQEFTYSFCFWNGSFADSRVIRDSYELNCPVAAVKGNGGEKSLFGVDAENIIIETVKPAEDRTGDIIVRMYEAKRMHRKCNLTTWLPWIQAYGTDMLEQIECELPVRDGKVELEFRPFEIKTVRLKRIQEENQTWQ